MTAIAETLARATFAPSPLAALPVALTIPAMMSMGIPVRPLRPPDVFVFGLVGFGLLGLTVLGRRRIRFVHVAAVRSGRVGVRLVLDSSSDDRLPGLGLHRRSGVSLGNFGTLGGDGIGVCGSLTIGLGSRIRCGRRR